MRKSAFLTICLLLLGLVFSSFSALHAAGGTVTLPRGTTVEKLGEGHFKLFLPDGREAVIKNYDPRSGILGDCGVYDKGKMVMQGKRGMLVGVIDPTPPHVVKADKGRTYVVAGADLVDLRNLSKVPKSEYVMIDDEITWLPGTVQIEPMIKSKKDSLPRSDSPAVRTVKLPKGTIAEKTAKGLLRLLLPDGQAVEIGRYDPKSGILGDCGLYNKGKLVAKGTRGSLVGVIDPDPPHIIRAGKEKIYASIGGGLVDLQNLSKVPRSKYLQIDDEVTWLPAKLKLD